MCGNARVQAIGLQFRKQERRCRRTLCGNRVPGLAVFFPEPYRRTPRDNKAKPDEWPTRRKFRVGLNESTCQSRPAGEPRGDEGDLNRWEYWPASARQI